MRIDYYAMRRGFEPANVTLVVIAESPPVTGNYFYNPEGKISEQLFSALMKQLGVAPKTKREGLAEFQNRGWLLIDATYTPVNGPGVDRDQTILADYPRLRGDLKQTLGDRWKTVPVVLVKANVCALLEPKLKEDGFNVLNEGRRVSFPGSGRQSDFARQFREIARAGS